MTLLCYYKTSAPPGSTSPVWNEETFVTGAPWDSLLVLTYFDANKLGQDSCLGQVGGFNAYYRPYIWIMNNACVADEIFTECD